MRSNRLLRVDDNKLSTGLMQVDCQDFLSTSLIQLLQLAASQQISNCIKSDFTVLIQPDDPNRLDGT